MKRKNDIYNVGNDYKQEVSAYFLDDADLPSSAYGKAYSDGLFHYTKKPVYELSGGASALNKRVFNKLPQKDWTPADFVTATPSAFSAATDTSAIFSPDYATVEDPTDNVWTKQ